jgi:hypothetical protein
VKIKCPIMNFNELHELNLVMKSVGMKKSSFFGVFGGLKKGCFWGSYFGVSKKGGILGGQKVGCAVCTSGGGVCRGVLHCVYTTIL